MSKRLVYLLLAIIIVLNLAAIISSRLGNEETDTSENEEVISADNRPQEQESKEEPEEKVEENPQEETRGEIGEGLFVEKAEAAETEDQDNSIAIKKSQENQDIMRREKKWLATNYASGDISTNSWRVRRGDTLWEIAEARYGSGHSWNKIRDLNPDKVGKLPNGKWGLILPGTILVLHLN